jgi:hypothetical protein
MKASKPAKRLAKPARKASSFLRFGCPCHQTRAHLYQLTTRAELQRIRKRVLLNLVLVSFGSPGSGISARLRKAYPRPVVGRIVFLLLISGKQTIRRQQKGQERVIKSGILDSEGSVNRREGGGLYVHRLVCSFVAGLAGGVLSLPCIQRSDSYSVAVRGSLADCAPLPA